MLKSLKILSPSAPEASWGSLGALLGYIFFDSFFLLEAYNSRAPSVSFDEPGGRHKGARGRRPDSQSMAELSQQPPGDSSMAEQRIKLRREANEDSVISESSNGVEFVAVLWIEN